MTTDMPRVQVTQPMLGLLYMQVCAVDDATDEEILSVCNRENLCGTSEGWCTVIRECDGSLGREKIKAPVACNDHPGRTHFLVSC